MTSAIGWDNGELGDQGETGGTAFGGVPPPDASVIVKLESADLCADRDTIVAVVQLANLKKR